MARCGRSTLISPRRGPARRRQPRPCRRPPCRARSGRATRITAAPHRRRDHRSAASSTCVRPQPGTGTAADRTRPARRTSPPPAAAPSPTAPAPAAARPARPARPQPLLGTSRRTSYRHHRGATAGTAQAAFPEVLAKDHGEGRCHHRHGHGDAVHHPPHPPNHTETTPSTAHTPAPWTPSKAGDTWHQLVKR